MPRGSLEQKSDDGNQRSAWGHEPALAIAAALAAAAVFTAATGAAGKHFLPGGFFSAGTASRYFSRTLTIGRFGGKGAWKRFTFAAATASTGQRIRGGQDQQQEQNGKSEKRAHGGRQKSKQCKDNHNRDSPYSARRAGFPSGSGAEFAQMPKRVKLNLKYSPLKCRTLVFRLYRYYFCTSNL